MFKCLEEKKLSNNSKHVKLQVNLMNIRWMINVAMKHARESANKS